METIQHYRCSLSPFQALKLFLWCFVNVCFAWKVSWRPGHESEWSENVIRGRLGPGLLHIDLTRWGHGNSESWQVYTEITARRIGDWKQTGIKKIGTRLWIPCITRQDILGQHFFQDTSPVSCNLNVSHVLIVDLTESPEPEFPQ